MIKGIFGGFLFVAGLGAIIILIQHNLGVLYFIIAGLILLGGLELIIDDKINDAKEDIFRKMNNK